MPRDRHDEKCLPAVAVAHGRAIERPVPTNCVEKLPVAGRCHFSVGPPTLTGTPIAAPGAICEFDLAPFETVRSENRVFQQNRPVAVIRSVRSGGSFAAVAVHRSSQRNSRYPPPSGRSTW